MSQSAPLKPRTLFLWPNAVEHGDVHGDSGHYRPPRPKKGSDANKSSDTQTWALQFRDSYTDSAGDHHYAIPTAVERKRLQAGTAAPYPEYEAQSHKDFGRLQSGKVQDGPTALNPGDDESLRDKLTLPCPRWGIVGFCEAGHAFCKELICNREWCPGCGGDGGKAHLRRLAGKLGRARQMGRMGKFTITVPPETRSSLRDPVKLAAFGISLKRMLQNRGFRRGLRRFHFFGEDHSHGSEGEGPPVFHPHLEAIVEAGNLSPRLLIEIKQGVAHILRVPFARVNVHYQYTRNVAKMMHMLRYMLRPTFENYSWDVPLAHALVGFKNSVSWGVWRDQDGAYLPAVWDVPESPDKPEIPEDLHDGHCPHDQTVIKWDGIMPVNLLQQPWWTTIGAGYWAHVGPSSSQP